MHQMAPAIHKYGEDYDFTKDADYMNHCDQLGIMKDIYDDKHNCSELTVGQIPAVLKEVVKMFLKRFILKSAWNCKDLLNGSLLI